MRSIYQPEQLFQLVPQVADVQASLLAVLRLRGELAQQLEESERHITHLRALADALTELKDDEATAAVACQLAGSRWPGTGEALVAAARGVLTEWNGT